jgi:hypothetical protein
LNEREKERTKRNTERTKKRENEKKHGTKRNGTKEKPIEQKRKKVSVNIVPSVDANTLKTTRPILAQYNVPVHITQGSKGV